MADAASSQVQNLADFGTTPKDVASRWKAEIKFAMKQRDSFMKEAEKLERRYINRDARSTRYSKFAVFWSNVEILKPAVYARAPKLEVSRRHDDDDAVARTAARILQRAGNFDIEHYRDFHDSLDPACTEYLTVGQGTVWLRFEAQVGDETIQISPNLAPSPFPTIKGERAPCDLVSWDHFLCSTARTWEEVRWVGRCVLYTQDEGSKRFDAALKKHGVTFKDVPLVKFGGETRNNEDKETNEDFLQRAVVWELWDKDTGMVYWINREFDYPLDMMKDPLRLTNFFPCPKPLLATLRPRSMVPKADYLFYQDQAQELNEVTAKLAALTDALQVIGIYDGSQAELQDLLKPNMSNRMVPVRSWAALADKGGLKGVVDFWPLDRIIETITALEQRRGVLLQLIYEITGISDIIRGATNANETLGAQQIKSKFAGLRLETRKGKAAEFAASAAAIKIEIMVRHFRVETIARLAAVEQMGEDPQLIAAAFELIKNEPEFCYRVEASVDTMVQIDMDGEKQEKMEFLGAVSNFIREATQAAQQQPAMAPLFMEMLKFGVRGFRVGRSLESKIDQTTRYMLQKLKEMETNPPPKPLTAPDASIKVAQMNNDTKLKIAGADVQVKATAMRQEHERTQVEAALDNNEGAEDRHLKLVTSERQIAHQQAMKAADLRAQAQQAAMAAIPGGQNGA
jgi:hypothetical protein